MPVPRTRLSHTAADLCALAPPPCLLLSFGPLLSHWIPCSSLRPHNIALSIVPSLPSPPLAHRNLACRPLAANSNSPLFLAHIVRCSCSLRKLELDFVARIFRTSFLCFIFTLVELPSSRLSLTAYLSFNGLVLHSNLHSVSSLPPHPRLSTASSLSLLGPSLTTWSFAPPAAWLSSPASPLLAPPHHLTCRSSSSPPECGTFASPFGAPCLQPRLSRPSHLYRMYRRLLVLTSLMIVSYERELRPTLGRGRMLPVELGGEGATR
ncbi:hypothetical protein EDB83DRAFT_2408414 [Lactarius deliciosus]|nr:hypothetical protein EDB83DRAFT_2408414 [Lactarius deliciosus]